MNVAELARDLELASSAVIEQCQRLGIDAAWTGAELTGPQEALLRTELAFDDDSPSWPTQQQRAVSGPGSSAPRTLVGATASLPPTAAGSFPGLSDGPDDGDGTRRHAGIHFAGDDVYEEASAETATSNHRRNLARPGGPRRDPAIGPATVALVLAGVAAAGSNVLRNPAAILGVWVLALVLLVVALWMSNHARYRISTHPDQRTGLVPAVVVMVAALLGLAGLGAAVWTVVRAAPADQAPLGIGTLQSVDRLRWGYRRVTAIADTSWERPAKDAGTCWSEGGVRRKQRRAERVELGNQPISCEAEHEHEVLGVFAVNRDADAAYPGVDRLEQVALERCAPIRAGLQGAPGNLRLGTEYPTADGWRAGDHDVTCVATATIRGSLLG